MGESHWHPAGKAGVPGLAEQSEEQIVTAFERDLKVTPQKTRLLIDVARIQRPVASAIRKRDFSIYVSIPFCPSRCQYCSFVSHSVEQAKSSSRITWIAFVMKSAKRPS